jgi:hypothetical protein
MSVDYLNSTETLKGSSVLTAQAKAINANTGIVALKDGTFAALHFDEKTNGSPVLYGADDTRLRYEEAIAQGLIAEPGYAERLPRDEKYLTAVRLRKATTALRGERVASAALAQWRA